MYTSFLTYDITDALTDEPATPYWAGLVVGVLSMAATTICVRKCKIIPIDTRYSLNPPRLEMISLVSEEKQVVSHGAINGM